MTGTRAVTVVFGGGGVWGVAWMTGLVKGMADLGLDIRSASAFIGTSAGSVVATHLSGPSSIDGLFDRQTQPDKQRFERAPKPGSVEAMAAVLYAPWVDELERLWAMCRLADQAETISAGQRRSDIVERIGANCTAWPERRLAITAIDMESLELKAFDAASGVSLVDAVTASCAVPGVWPPALIDGRRYVDGGVWRTSDNAHLAAGSQSVLILSPLSQLSANRPSVIPGLEADVAQLEADGATVVVVGADANALQTMAPGPLDPATRSPGAEAGRSQAAQVFDAVSSLFGA